MVENNSKYAPKETFKINYINHFSFKVEKVIYSSKAQINRETVA